MVTEGKISQADIDSLHVTDDMDEVVDILINAAAKRQNLVDEWGVLQGTNTDQPPIVYF
jgi:predicted Rossmann-fold nucleotide-binding protein